MPVEFSPEKVGIAAMDFAGGHYATLLGQVDKWGEPGTTLDYGIGLHPSLHPMTLADQRPEITDLANAIDNHSRHVKTISDPIRRAPLEISLRGLRSRLGVLTGESVNPSKMAYDAYNIEFPDAPYDDSWVGSYYEHEVLPLIPEKYFPDGIRTTENFLSAYTHFKNSYRLNVLRSSTGSKTEQEAKVADLGRFVARLIMERTKAKGVLTFDDVDAALESLIIKPVIDSPGGESGYFRFNADAKPEDTVNWYTNEEPTPWELLLSQTHELAGHYQEYTEKNAMAWQRGWTEWSVAGLYSPAAFFSEGVAQVIPRYLYPDAETIRDTVLKIYEQAGQRFDEKGQEDILSLIKIHFLTEFNPELELVRINANRKIEQVLGMPEGPDRETALEDAKKYSQIMNLRSPEQAERRVKFMARYGGYAYVYPVSARAYWAWFEKHDQTPEAMLRLMREPIVLGVNEEMPEIS